jgi:hypothetical protein
MSFKLTYGKIMDNNFYGAVRKLATAQFTDYKTSYWISQICKGIQEKRIEVGDAYNKEVVDRFAKKDDEGKILNADGVEGRFDVNPDNQEEFEKYRDGFFAEEAEFNFNTFPLSKVAEARLTPVDLIQLEGIYKEPELDA